MSNLKSFIKSRKSSLIKSFIKGYLIILPFTFFPLLGKHIDFQVVIERLPLSLLYTTLFTTALIAAGINEEYKKINKPVPSPAQRPRPTPFMEKEKAKKVVARLVELGYFKYVESTHMDEIREALEGILSEVGEVGVEIYEPETDGMLGDFRVVNIGDGEELYEEEGLDHLFTNLKPRLEKMGLKIENYQYIKKYSNGFPLMKMLINGREYIITEEEDNKEWGPNWGQSITLFIGIINDLLMRGGVDERLYVLPEENLIFLNKELYNFLAKAEIKESCKPYLPED